MVISALLGVVCSVTTPILAARVRVAEGPTVLHASLRQQWGGHTFGYLVEGKRALFWSGILHDATDTGLTAIVGQYPKKGRREPPATKLLTFSEPDVIRCNQPQMVRTPDGYIHIFIGLTYKTNNPNFNSGRLRYLRSRRPEDITELEDRTSLLPTKPFADFHLRMNVGISRDGTRMALVILAISEDDSIPFNTPVVFFGKRKGLDFVFDEPKQYAEPTGLFYPMIAATTNGVVIVGENWTKWTAETPRSWMTLLHIGWNGQLLHREDSVMDSDGTYMAFDLRPVSTASWNKLALYMDRVPKDQSKPCRHEVWLYDVVARKLSLVRSIETTQQLSNYGKWVPISPTDSILLNNPCMGVLHAWSGDLFGSGDITHEAIPGTDPIALGYSASAYLFVPSPLHGSVESGNGFYLASDFYNQPQGAGKVSSCSFLLWRMVPSD